MEPAEGGFLKPQSRGREVVQESKGRVVGSRGGLLRMQVLLLMCLRQHAESDLLGQQQTESEYMLAVQPPPPPPSSAVGIPR